MIVSVITKCHSHSRIDWNRYDIEDFGSLQGPRSSLKVGGRGLKFSEVAILLYY